MKKMIFSLFALSSLMMSSLSFADSRCDQTWETSSAAQSCGTVCTNPLNTYHYPFSSTYNEDTGQCTFKAGCCQGYPGQSCTYNYAVCSPTGITVKQGDNQFYNDHGTIKHN
jgi:hypothetical protein